MYRLFVCLRYLRKRPTAALAILAVTFGVATLLTVLAIMEGYIIRLREMIRDQDAHMVVRATSPLGLCDIDTLRAAVESVPHVVATAETVETLAMYRSDRFNPCFLRGIEPTRELAVTHLGRFLLRPGELDGVLAALDGDGDAKLRRGRAEELARELVNDDARRPLSETEVASLFSREWRETIVAGLPEIIRSRLERGGVLPSAVVVGLHFLTSQDLSLGQVVKIATVRPGTSDLVEGNFIVAGAFKTGSFDLDSKLFFIHNRRMSTFLHTLDPAVGMPCYEKVRVALDDYRHASDVVLRIRAALASLPPETGGPEALVQTWEDQKSIFLQAVTIEKWIMGFVVSLLNIFTACIILLMLVLLVIEKTRDAGILLSIGATPGGVFGIFLLNGVVIATIGTVAGLGLGALFVANLNPIHDFIFHMTGYRLFDPEVYLMDSIPTKITPGDVLFSVVPALLFGVVASLVPAAWAARKDPIKAIHHE